jgi:putative ABC transport system substrate-binding protein
MSSVRVAGRLREDPVIDRRGLLAGTGALLLAAPLAARAQPAATVPRIGYLSPISPPADSARIEAFRQGLRDLGYVEGQSIVIEYRYADGKFDRLPDLAAGLVRLKVDVIVAASTPGILAAKQATSAIPIVMTLSADPVPTGLVSSLARPGANITGLSLLSGELNGKRLELLKEIVPSLSRVAALWNPDNPASRFQLKETEAAAHVLGIQLQPLEVRGPDPDFERIFQATGRGRISALITPDDLLIFSHRARIVDLAARKRLPAMYAFREFVDAGGLMSYTANRPHLFRRAATYVDKILRGARPGDLPVEQPTKFELVINLKAARALGLAIPSRLLALADEVIQ